MNMRPAIVLPPGILSARTTCLYSTPGLSHPAATLAAIGPSFRLARGLCIDGGTETQSSPPTDTPRRGSTASLDRWSAISSTGTGGARPDGQVNAVAGLLLCHKSHNLPPGLRGHSPSPLK